MLTTWRPKRPSRSTKPKSVRLPPSLRKSMQKEHARDALVNAERKAHGMQNGLEEARTLLEQADRNRRMTEQDLSDANEQLSDATVQNQAIAAGKRKLESEMQTLHVSTNKNNSLA